MLKKLSKLLLILGTYLTFMPSLAICQFNAKYSQYIVSLNQSSIQSISQGEEKRILMRKLFARFGLVPLRVLPLDETYLVKIANKKRFTGKSEELKQYFNYIEPDQRANINEDFFQDENEITPAAAIFPNDPEINFNSWGLDPYYGTDALDAWDFDTGGKNNEVVAVLGTGIDLSHQDLSANLWKDSAPSPANKKETVDGFNVYNTTIANPPADDHGITTFAAGIIGAKGNNSKGIAGIDWGVKLMPVKVLNTSFNSTVTQFIDGIDYVIRKKQAGANVVAIFNFTTFAFDSTALRNKIQDAGNAGILFITAAGDANKNVDSQTVVPPSFNLSNMISVGSYYGTLNQSKPPYFSDIYYSTATPPYTTFRANFGAVKVHLAAPGERVRSTWKGNSYMDFAGTTVSAAYVAGAAALLKSYSPSSSIGQIKDAILNNTRKYPAELNGKVSTQGVLDIYLAIKSLRTVLPGDYDLNGSVDGNDFLIWQRNFGATGINPADGNKDGRVDAADYTIWKDNYGRTL